MKMKKTIKLLAPTYFLMIMLLATILNSCNKFEELQYNPNNPTTGSPNLVLPYLIQSVFYNGNPTGWAAASQQLFYTERREATQYWGWRADAFSWYTNIRQTVKMEEEALRTGAQAYIPIARFIRQLAFYEQTRSVGDIPYTEAMKAEEENFTPKYDLQKDVFIGILNELEAINTSFAELSGQSISGDLIYGGDLSKWQKLVNSYHLKILLDLSMKESDSDLNIRRRFQDIFSNRAKYPIFESNADMPRFRFFDQENNRYPTYNQITTRIQQKLTNTVVDYLVAHKDPRIFAFAEPAWPEGSEFWTDAERTVYRADFSSYKGLDPALVHGEGSQQRSSNLHWRYYENPTGEDYVKFSYSELNFILAEAVLRNWISGDAQHYYEQGINASLEFFEVSDQGVARILPTDIRLAIEEVNMQKYIGFFMNSAWEAWYNHRRMKAHGLGPDGQGVPAFKAGDSHFVTQPPLRWEYPQSEIFNNELNVKEALDRQFGGENDIDGLMWMIK